MVYLSLDKLDDKSQYWDEVEAAKDIEVVFDKNEGSLIIYGKISGNRRLYASLDIDEIPRELQLAIIERSMKDLSDLIMMILQLIKEVKR